MEAWKHEKHADQSSRRGSRRVENGEGRGQSEAWAGSGGGAVIRPYLHRQSAHPLPIVKVNVNFNVNCNVSCNAELSAAAGSAQFAAVAALPAAASAACLPRRCACTRLRRLVRHCRRGRLRRRRRLLLLLLRLRLWLRLWLRLLPPGRLQRRRPRPPRPQGHRSASAALVERQRGGGVPAPERVGGATRRG
jgi:hypothetical protein